MENNLKKQIAAIKANEGAKVSPSYHEDVLREHWGNGKPLEHEGKQIHVGQMSYGDYFAHPYDAKHPEGRGERDNNGQHRSDVKWFSKDESKKGHYKLGSKFD